MQLVDGKPTSYRYGDGVREMTPRPVTVQVREPDGSLHDVEHTAYFSHYGPVLDFPGVGWTAQHVLAVRDANWDNDESWRQWLEMDRARSLQEFQQVHATNQGLAWVNTIAASAEGVAWYADTSATPNLRPEAIEAWKQRREKDPFTEKLWQQGIVLLDGSDPLFEWVDDEGARDPGIVAYKHMPQVERSDYVFNSNDSYWLANSSAPLTGPYSPLHGEPGTPRSLRTRQNDRTLSNRSPDHAAGDDGKFSLDEIERAVLSNLGLTAELIRPTLVERCRKTPHATIDGRRVDLAEACGVLAAWDGRYDLDSRGAVLFREFLGQYDPADLTHRGKLFAVAFDPQDPVNTPRDLAPAGPKGDLALENLARAVTLLHAQNIALDAPLGDLQYANKPGRRVPIHGGNGAYEGILNFEQSSPNTTTLEPLDTPKSVEGSRFLTEKGYPVSSGTSFVMALEYTAQGPACRGTADLRRIGRSALGAFLRPDAVVFSKEMAADPVPRRRDRRRCEEGLYGDRAALSVWSRAASAGRVALRALGRLRKNASLARQWCFMGTIRAVSHLDFFRGLRDSQGAKHGDCSLRPPPAQQPAKPFSTAR